MKKYTVKFENEAFNKQFHSYDEAFSFCLQNCAIGIQPIGLYAYCTVAHELIELVKF